MRLYVEISGLGDMRNAIDVVFLIVFGFLSAGMVLVVYGTISKNRWGINLGEVSCPRCNKVFPKVRRPQSHRQALWGGGTCANCGIEVDKWGREVPTAHV